MSDPVAPREPDLFDRLWSAFQQALADERSVGPWGWVVVAGVSGVAASLLVLAPTLYVNDMALDLFIPLDGAWRSTFGHRPHADFVTPIGDLYYWTLAVAAQVTGGSPRTLAVANALFGVPVVAAAWWVARDRLPEPLRTATALAIALCAMSPRTLDSLSLIGFNAMYNRWAWALVSVAAVAMVLPARSSPRRGAAGAVEPLLVAACVVATLWVKVTFLPVVVVSMLVALAGDSAQRVAAVGALGGLMAGGVSLMTPWGWAYVGDLIAVREASAAAGGLLRVEKLAPVVLTNAVDLGLLGAAVFGLMRLTPAAEQGRASVVVGLSALLLGAGLLVGQQNNDQTVPVIGLCLLMVVTFALRERAGLGSVLMAAASLVVVGRPVLLDFGTIAQHTALSSLSSTTLVHEGPLALVTVPGASPGYTPLIERVRDGRIPAKLYDNLAGSEWWVDDGIILRDGIALLKAHGGERRKVATLTFSPIFSYATGSEPPRGLPAWWDYGRTFGPTWRERACTALADTDVVMQPHVWIIQGLYEEHSACLRSQFAVAGSSALWTMWVRKVESADPLDPGGG